jgi:uncharacterized protein YraI
LLAQAPQRVTYLKVILREARAPFDDFRRIDNVLPPLLHIVNPGVVVTIQAMVDDHRHPETYSHLPFRLSSPAIADEGHEQTGSRLEEVPMRFTKSIFTAAVATIVLAASAAGVFAAPASATSNVNVRSGPGTGFHVVSQLVRGQHVEVEGCEAGWCYVSQRGVDGWVSAQYLTARAASNRPNFYKNFGTLPHRPGYNRPHPDRPSFHKPQPPRPGYQHQPPRPGHHVSPPRPGQNFNHPPRPGSFPRPYSPW